MMVAKWELHHASQIAILNLQMRKPQPACGYYWLAKSLLADLFSRVFGDASNHRRRHFYSSERGAAPEGIPCLFSPRHSDAQAFSACKHWVSLSRRLQHVDFQPILQYVCMVAYMMAYPQPSSSRCLTLLRCHRFRASLRRPAGSHELQLRLVELRDTSSCLW